MLEYSCNSFIYTLCVFVSLFLSFSLSLSPLSLLSLSLSLSECVCTVTTCVTRRARIASLLVMGSRCRGGIVNIRCGCSRARIRTAHSPTALWRFRASTSNSPSGRSGRIHTRTFAILIILTLNKIFEYVKMTIFSRPSGSPRIPRRFGFFA